MPALSSLQTLLFPQKWPLFVVVYALGQTVRSKTCGLEAFVLSSLQLQWVTPPPPTLCGRSGSSVTYCQVIEVTSGWSVVLCWNISLWFFSRKLVQPMSKASECVNLLSRDHRGDSS
jgi:hypothetical protein